MVRGSGKFKAKRGGGRQFSRNMVLDENGTAVSTDKRWQKETEGSNSDEEDEEEESEEESEEEEEEEEGDQDPNKPELSRAERKELKRKQAAEKLKQKQKQAGGGGGGDDDGSEDDSDLINPNHVKKKMNVSDLSAPRELSRKEREAKEKQDAKDKYWKLHLAGKTDQAKADLSRLAKIRAEREAAAEKRKAEAEAKQAEVEAKQAATGNRR